MRTTTPTRGGFFTGSAFPPKIVPEMSMWGNFLAQ